MKKKTTTLRTHTNTTKMLEHKHKSQLNDEHKMMDNKKNKTHTKNKRGDSNGVK